MGPGGGRDGGTELDLLMVAGAAVFAVGLIYYFFHEQILHALFFLKYYELKGIEFFIPAIAHVDAAIQYGYEHPQVLTFHDLFLVSDRVGDFLKYPLSVISAIFGALLYLSHPDKLYNQKENMSSLSEKMVDAFPALRVVQTLDLVKTPIDKGPWAMGQTPVEWANDDCS